MTQNMKAEMLARRLFRRAEHLDPGIDCDIDAEDWGWSKLSDRKQSFWKQLAEEALFAIDDAAEYKRRLAAVFDESDIGKFGGHPYDEYLANIFHKMVDAI